MIRNSFFMNTLLAGKEHGNVWMQISGKFSLAKNVLKNYNLPCLCAHLYPVWNKCELHMHAKKSGIIKTSSWLCCNKNTSRLQILEIMLVSFLDTGICGSALSLSSENYKH
jgi:hypothetical protein